MTSESCRGQSIAKGHEWEHAIIRHTFLFLFPSAQMRWNSEHLVFQTPLQQSSAKVTHGHMSLQRDVQVEGHRPLQDSSSRGHPGVWGAAGRTWGNWGGLQGYTAFLQCCLLSAQCTRVGSSVHLTICMCVCLRQGLTMEPRLASVCRHSAVCTTMHRSCRNFFVT